MSSQSARMGRAMACGALAFCVAASPLVAGVSVAQTLSSHDAAVAATTKGDYVGALELAKRAAAEGQALDPDQLDFITAKAAKQQAQRDADAKVKATQIAAQATAEQIQARQQKDYAERAKRGATSDNCAVTSGQQAMAVGQFSSSYAAAANQVLGPSGQGGPAFSGAPAGPPPISNEQPGNCSSGGVPNPGSRIVK